MMTDMAKQRSVQTGHDGKRLQAARTCPNDIKRLA